MLVDIDIHVGFIVTYIAHLHGSENSDDIGFII